MLINESLLNQIYEVISPIGFLPMLVILYLVVMYFFWYSSYRANKDSGSVFDQWFFTTLIMIVWGRVAYIIEFWDQYSRWPWFWLPYERYGDTIYWFRTLPWRFFAIWDGGFLFIPMFFAFLILSFFYVVKVKKWRWRDMMVGVIATANYLLGATLLVYGVFVDSASISNNGLYLLIYTFVFQLVIRLFKWIWRKNEKARDTLSHVVVVIITIVECWMISIIFLKDELTRIDELHVYAIVGLLIIMLISYILDLRKPKLDEVLVPEQSVMLNKALKGSVVKQI